ncbi:MAG: hypothetical protein ACP5I6_04840 [Caldisphaera sp.]|jgi:hypothetical protein|nr:hypothetical protein [Caldisphaera sp.]PMP59663.1 MAG: hypothetical protein C0201_04505 [Caldisphaera sp.]
MKRVLSEDNMDDFEPTPGVGPCIEEFLKKSEELDEINSISQNKETNYVDILLYDNEKLEFYLRTFVGIDCLHIIDGVLESCENDIKDMLKKYADFPEVSKVEMQGNCIRLIIPSTPIIRIKKFLEKINIKFEKILSYRLVYDSGVDFGDQV